MFRNFFQCLKGAIAPKNEAIKPGQTVVPSPFFLTDKLSEIHGYFAGYDIFADSFLQIDGSLPGFCFICEEEVEFEVERPDDGSPVNWRETLKCPHCGMINRWRACIHLFQEICQPTKGSRIYLTESLSPIHEYVSQKFRKTIASEYFSDAAPGELVKRNNFSIRNEDITRLTFGDDSFDVILCFDVLEHVPDYKKALHEIRRVLSDGGHLLLTLPFSFQEETVVRAAVNPDGTIEHFMEPCYHGDPLSDEGVLAFYDFGMCLKDELIQAGFKAVNVACFRSNIWGYPAGNIAFIAS